MKKIKLLTSTFRYPTVNENKLVKMLKIIIYKANDIIRTTTQTTVRDVTNPFTR